MTETTCRCGRPAPDAYVCPDCADQLARALGDVPWLDDELETTITRQRATTTEGSTSRSATTPLPWHEKASDARRTLHGLLSSWARMCHEDGVRSGDYRPGLPDDVLTDMSRWMLWRVDGLALHPAGPDAVDEITDAVAACHRLIDRRPDREFVGPCECGRDLYRRPGAIRVECGWCEREFDPEALLTWMRGQVMGRLVTAREGAGLLSKFGLATKQATIDKWRERKRITERGHNPDGHRLYLFDELVEVASRNAEQPVA